MLSHTGLGAACPNNISTAAKTAMVRMKHQIGSHNIVGSALPWLWGSRTLLTFGVLLVPV